MDQTLDFHKRERLAAKERDRLERDDIQNEMAGRETNRMKRLGEVPGSPAAEKKRREREERQKMDRLAVLMSDPAYRALYEDVSNTLSEQQTRTQEQLQLLEERLEAIDRRLDDTGPNAPSAQERERLERERLDLQRRQQDWLDYQINILESAQDRLNDNNNPPDMDELDQIRRDLIDSAPKALVSPSQPDQAPDLSEVQPPTNAAIPDLRL